MTTKTLLTILAIGCCMCVQAQDMPVAGDIGTGAGRADSAIYAKRQPMVINEVVITGQYAPKSEENAVQKVQVIDRKKIDAMGAQNLKDVLTNQLNVRLSQDAILGSSMSLQGVSGEDVKILIDGVPVIGRHDGNIDLAQIDLHNIDRIEIIEGPMSVNYGTDALAGTINLITKKTQPHLLSIGMSAYYETIGTYNMNGRIGVHKNNHTFIVTGARNFFSGWKPGEKNSFFDFSAQVADKNRYMLWKPREQYQGGLQYIYTIGKTTLTYSGNYFQELIIDRGTPGLPYGENTFDGYYRTLRTDNAVFLKSEIASHKFLNVFVSYNTYRNIANSYYVDLTTLDKTLSDANGAQDTSKFRQLSSRATFSTGNPQKKVNYEVGYDINAQHANGTMMKAGAQHMGDYAIFASAEYKLFNAVTLRPGLRYSYNTDYQAPVIPSINMLYKVSDNLKLRASYARGFRAPSLQELYFYFVDVNHNIIGNTDLKAEYSNNYSLMAAYSGQVDGLGYKIDGGLFYNDINNLITLARKGTGTEYTYINIGKYRTEGLQVTGLLNFNHISISVGGSYIGTYNQLSESGNLPAYSYTPEVRSSIYYDITKIGFRTSLFYKYTGRATGYTIDAANNVKQTFIDAYSMADASVSKFFFGKKLNVAAGCKNLFDIQNINAYASGSAHSAAGNNVPIATGRYFFIKLDLGLNSK